MDQEMDPTFSKAQGKTRGSSAKTASEETLRKSKKEHNETERGHQTQNAGQPSGPGRTAARQERDRSRSRSRNADEGSVETPQTGGKFCCSCCRRRSPSDSMCVRLLSCLGLKNRKKVDDFVVFDDKASLDQALLWPDNGSRPNADDYMEFAPEHEKGLAERVSNVRLPSLPKDRTDY
eukprot:CAMPEP_0172546050 /NCGR_PEP_ID=MMETSP1067-20121228/15876_1 /TAXON_ID=265564 ORGANISM="Thalassiosira punctigera, Strain Tpunct2005C2" /NCGR_SAMPLE_ID=MMETSP1067 /ASSEMBLY_ACC=CAM_ASM_000444 /LENGTH=177 /DNA_ID=CAMNT_0013332915 /DNA_START=224 /DNA_END=757 /DNA_ORIENTATION=-